LFTNTFNDNKNFICDANLHKIRCKMRIIVTCLLWNRVKNAKNVQWMCPSSLCFSLSIFCLFVLSVSLRQIYTRAHERVRNNAYVKNKQNISTLESQACVHLSIKTKTIQYFKEHSKNISWLNNEQCRSDGAGVSADLGMNCSHTIRLIL
jgi:hypothetical protein